MGHRKNPFLICSFLSRRARSFVGGGSSRNKERESSEVSVCPKASTSLSPIRSMNSYSSSLLRDGVTVTVKGIDNKIAELKKASPKITTSFINMPPPPPRLPSKSSFRVEYSKSKEYMNLRDGKKRSL